MSESSIWRHPGVRKGLPVVGATLVTVQEILCELWLGATPEQAAERLPGIAEQDVWSALVYAAECLEDEAAAAAALDPYSPSSS